MIGPGGCYISSSHVYAVPVTVLLVGLPQIKKKQTFNFIIQSDIRSEDALNRVIVLLNLLLEGET
jgi:hypothetical protein